MVGKYLKPKSLTWWGGFVPLVSGIVVATEPLHQWVDVTTTINNLSGGMSAYLMINMGLVAIGVRGAIND